MVQSNLFRRFASRRAVAITMSFGVLSPGLSLAQSAAPAPDAPAPAQPTTPAEIQPDHPAGTTIPGVPGDKTVPALQPRGGVVDPPSPSDPMVKRPPPATDPAMPVITPQGAPSGVVPK